MGKYSLAAKLSDELGGTIDDGLRWVDEIGSETAAKTADEAAEGGSSVIGDWWKPATAVGGVGSGAALAWRQQDIMKAEKIASQQEDYASAAKSIMESDMSPRAKKEMLKQLNNNSPSTQNAGKSGDGGLFDDPMMIVVGLVILAFVLRYTLGSDA